MKQNPQGNQEKEQQDKSQDKNSRIVQSMNCFFERKEKKKNQTKLKNSKVLEKSIKKGKKKNHTSVLLEMRRNVHYQKQQAGKTQVCFSCKNLNSPNRQNRKPQSTTKKFLYFLINKKIYCLLPQRALECD